MDGYHNTVEHLSTQGQVAKFEEREGFAFRFEKILPSHNKAKCGSGWYGL